MPYSTTNKPPHRGTIIVDACILKDLASAVDSSLCRNTQAPKYYLDTLKFLSQQGYKIVIPEMVALESAGILRNGINVRDVCGDKKNESIKILEPFLRDALLSPSNPAKRYPNITIARNTGPQHVDDLCNLLTHTTGNNSRWQQTELINSTYHDNHKDFGDDAIVSLVESMQHTPANKPIFALSDDVGLFGRARDLSPPINNIKFLYGLQLSGLGRHFGFLQEIEPDTLAFVFSSSIKTRRDPYYNMHSDQICHIIDDPFYSSIKQLTAELDAETPEQKTNILRKFSRVKAAKSGEVAAL